MGLWANEGTCFTKHFCIYELKYLINSCETMPANIQETLIYNLIMQHTSSYCLSETSDP